jgi:hypothetical protein
MLEAGAAMLDALEGMTLTASQQPSPGSCSALLAFTAGEQPAVLDCSDNSTALSVAQLPPGGMSSCCRPRQLCSLLHSCAAAAAPASGGGGAVLTACVGGGAVARTAAGWFVQLAPGAADAPVLHALSVRVLAAVSPGAPDVPLLLSVSRVAPGTQLLVRAGRRLRLLPLTPAAEQPSFTTGAQLLAATLPAELLHAPGLLLLALCSSSGYYCSATEPLLVLQGDDAATTAELDAL